MSCLQHDIAERGFLLIAATHSVLKDVQMNELSTAEWVCRNGHQAVQPRVGRHIAWCPRCGADIHQVTASPRAKPSPPLRSVA